MNRVKHKLNSHIEFLLKEYTGGEEYFNKLDEFIKAPENSDIILSILLPLKNKHIISSGGFGERINSLLLSNKFSCKSLTVFNGGICTQGKSVESFISTTTLCRLKNKNVIFVDDSLYSGKTLLKIQEHLNSLNITVSEILVVYDGSNKNLGLQINSLYKYHK